jgi:hypothetical protein
MNADVPSERDDITLRVLALIERTTVAGQRRKAIRSYCATARTDENIAGIVRLVMAHRRVRDGNVISIGGGRP